MFLLYFILCYTCETNSYWGYKTLNKQVAQRITHGCVALPLFVGGCIPAGSLIWV